MELCSTPAASNATILSFQCLPKFFPANSPSSLRSKPNVALKRRVCSRSLLSLRLVPRASLSDDNAAGTNTYAPEEGRSAVVTVENDNPPLEKNNEIDEAPAEQQAPLEDQANGFLDNLDIKFDSEDSYSILVFGGGALAVLWLASAVVSAVDSIPLFPKLMEVVGLGYTTWFATRYLLFKENRDELRTKVEELKQQILGSNDD